MSEEKRERGSNREKIIDAAYRVLAEKGYEAATIKQIAAQAGVALGLVHYYFKDKDELLAAVLHEASDRYVAVMKRQRYTPATSSAIALGLAEPMARATEQPEWYRLRYELFALGLRNPAMLPSVGALLANGRNGISNVASKIGGDAISDPDALAAVLLACFDGLVLQKLADPDFDLQCAYAMLTQLIAPLLGAE